MKKLDKRINYSVYKYAPESFKLTIFDTIIKLDHQTASTFGNLAICKPNDLLPSIKRFIRKYTNVTKNHKKLLFTIPLKNSNDYVHIRDFVDKYDIQEKLLAYKYLKRTLEANGYKNPIKIQTATLDANMNPYDVHEIENKLELANRVKLI